MAQHLPGRHYGPEFDSRFPKKTKNNINNLQDVRTLVPGVGSGLCTVNLGMASTLVIIPVLALGSLGPSLLQPGGQRGAGGQVEAGP